jgi:hypothetical protein
LSMTTLTTAGYGDIAARQVGACVLRERELGHACLLAAITSARLCSFLRLAPHLWVQQQVLHNRAKESAQNF